MAQKWLKIIQEAGADSIRLAVDPDPRIDLSETKVGKATVITVHAAIDRRWKLQVKGNSFDLADSRALGDWIRGIRKLKSLDPDEQPGAFGLTPAQLVAVHERLGVPFEGKTRNQNVADLLRKIRARVGIPISVSDKNLEILNEKTLVPDELNGLACGTVLASIIRPLGLVFSVTNEGNRIVLLDSREAKEHWPIGWPLQEPPSKVAPILFKQTEFSIDGFPLNEVLQAIEAKTRIPFVLDQNTMARHGIELKNVRISIDPIRTTYNQIIRKCLNQTRPRLSAELRADEAGQPFFWVSH